MADHNAGLDFEYRVLQLYDGIAYRNVSHDVIHKHEGHVSQIDIEYETLLGKKRYVECKHRSGGKPVSLEEIAKFGAVLELIGAKTSQGEFFTDTGYTARARRYAESKRIKIYDCEYIEHLEAKLNTIPRKLKRKLFTKFYK